MPRGLVEVSERLIMLGPQCRRRRVGEDGACVLEPPVTSLLCVPGPGARLRMGITEGGGGRQHDKLPGRFHDIFCCASAYSVALVIQALQKVFSGHLHILQGWYLVDVVSFEVWCTLAIRNRPGRTAVVSAGHGGRA